MIGLCHGLAMAELGSTRFVFVSREEVERYPASYMHSKRYYEAIDACPLRMSREDQP